MLKVYVVDDDAIARQSALMALEDLPVEAVEIDSGAAMLAALSEAPESEDILLLDIEMPGIDGLEVCRRLRASGHHRLTIVFLSSHNDLETRLTAYEAGGDDFVIKPADFSAIEAAVRLALDQHDAHLRLVQQVDQATSTAITAISSMSEVWPVVDFFRNSLSLNSAQQLANRLIQAIDSYGLTTLADIRAETTLQLSAHGPCQELERSILTHAAKGDRLFQIGNRLALNFPHATVVVSGLPKEDPARLERLRDYIAIMVEAASNRAELLRREHQRLAQAAGIVEAAGALSQTLTEAQKTHEQVREQTKLISDNLIYEMDSRLRMLRLSDTQQSELMHLAHDAVSRIANLQLHATRAATKLGTVAAQLEALAKTD